MEEIELTGDEQRRVTMLQTYFAKYNYSPDYFHGNDEAEQEEALKISDVLSGWYATDRPRFLQVMSNLGYAPQESDTGGEIWWCWLKTPHGRLTAWISTSAMSDMADTLEDYHKAQQSKLGKWWFTIRYRIGVWLEDRRNRNK